MLTRLKTLLTPKVKLALRTIVYLVLGFYAANFLTKNNIQNNSVMVVARSMDHGGTGVILKSSKAESQVLTNSHVCGVIKNGGVVVTIFGSYQVNSYKESLNSDLCILTVQSDLHYNTKLARSIPKMYESVKVSGHPALMPNIISTGHISGDAIIPVITGMKACADEDYKNEPLLCTFLGGIPIIKFYPSRLVSATIMPGSSGSGVYNSNDDLVGLVFAGSGDFGYGWTVPYEQVKAFVENEAPKRKFTVVDQTMEMRLQGPQVKDVYREAVQKCLKIDLKTVDSKVANICKLLMRDVVWVQ